MKTCIITDIASPYQVELFNTVAESEPDFSAIYVRKADPSRQWEAQDIRHDHSYLEDLSPEVARSMMADADLCVFSFYGSPRVDAMMRQRAELRRPWCFWGERLGFRHAGLVGRLYRRWKLRSLHRHPVPIWGIGTWAVESYRREFGKRRRYFPIPYFSDLGRFDAARATGTQGDGRQVVLYSGSLSERKGVDLLARAFLRMAPEFPNWRLVLMGVGPLRADLQAQLAPLGEQVEFLGFKDWHELPDAYAQADLLCVPSRHDGWALVVPEGLAAGLPVIGTDRTGAAIDLIAPSINGWLCQANNLESLESALRAAAALSPDELASMSQAAAETARKHSLAAGAERLLQAAATTVSDWK